MYLWITEHPTARGISNFDFKDEIYCELHMEPIGAGRMPAVPGEEFGKLCLSVSVCVGTLCGSAED